MLSKPAPEFQFAGFTFPKFVWDLPRGSFKKRIAHMKHPFTGGYYHAPTPVTGSHPGRGFYLTSDGGGKMGLRWKWADEVADADIQHRGWYCDDYHDQTIRGIVMALPHGRGWLAGWSMGVDMASGVDGTIYHSEADAAYAADSMAEYAAEEQRDYEASQEGTEWN